MNHRPAARIAADSGPVLVFTVVLTVAVALASFALSFAALRDAALWGRVPQPIAFLVPVVIDASVLVYGLVALVLRARGRSSAWAWFLMFGFTAVSVGANAAHAADVPDTIRLLVGVLLSALAPVSVLTTTHALGLLVVAHPADAEPVQVEPLAVPDAPPAPVQITEPVPAAVLAPVAAAPAIAPPVVARVPVVEPEPSPVAVPAPVPAAAAVASVVEPVRRPRLGRVPVPAPSSSLDQDMLPGLAGLGVSA